MEKGDMTDAAVLEQQEAKEEADEGVAVAEAEVRDDEMYHV